MVRDRILGRCRECDAIDEEQDTSDDAGREPRFTSATAVRVLPVPVAISTAHRAFGNADALLDFVESIAAALGLPVGIKAAVGDATFWTDRTALAHALDVCTT